MYELFSCRNCIHNGAQSLNLGRGVGYCLQHDSLIHDPAETTCKYLHRKDLPNFVVEEGIKEHASEYVQFSGLVSLRTKKPIRKEWYSERKSWEQRDFDPLVLLASRYHRAPQAWVLIQTISGKVDGRLGLMHAALMRRYMNQCGTWTSSVRLVLSIIQEINAKPQFSVDDLIIRDGDDEKAVVEDAMWEVLFTRFCAIQEYGWHAGIEELLWATDHLNGALVELNWDKLNAELSKKREQWTKVVIKHAKAEDDNGGISNPEVDVPEEVR